MAVDIATGARSRTLRRRGSLTLALFASLWAVNGVWETLSSRGELLSGVAAAVAVTAAVSGLGLRGTPLLADERLRRLPPRWSRHFGMVNLAQVAAIALSGALLPRAGLSALGPAAVCLIVGLHFVPLARLCDQPQYRWTAGLMASVAALGCLSFTADASGGSTRVVVGLGAGAVLWGTATHLAVRG